MSDVAIKVDNVSKSFRLPHEKVTSIKSAFTGLFSGKRTFEKQEVLKNISLEIKKGEFFGIVGRNGSGKSTLLKLLAGIYSPDEGRIQVNGKLTPFIELGVGFNPELTGRENVFLNGSLLGFNRKEMDSMYDEIVEFAELEKFMDQKLKNYSSGMQVRLAFSIAIRAKTGILLIDEVLAVGDTAFQKKCYEHFLFLKKQGKTVVLVTHDMTAVERFCTKVLVLHQGVRKGIFTPREAASFYDELNSESVDNKKTNKIQKEKGRWGTKEVEITNIYVEGALENIAKTFTVKQGKDIALNIETKSSTKRTKQIVIGLAFFNQYGVNLSGPNSMKEKLSSDKIIKYIIPRLSFNPGEYEITVVVFDPQAINEYDHIEKAIKLNVVAEDHQKHGAIELFGGWVQ